MSTIIDNSAERIERLWGHLGNMTPDEIREHIRRTRGERKKRKEKAAVKKATRVKADKAQGKVKDLASTDPELLERLLKELGDG